MRSRYPYEEFEHDRPVGRHQRIICRQTEMMAEDVAVRFGMSVADVVTFADIASETAGSVSQNCSPSLERTRLRGQRSSFDFQLYQWDIENAAGLIEILRAVISPWPFKLDDSLPNRFENTAQKKDRPEGWGEINGTTF